MLGKLLLIHHEQEWQEGLLSYLRHAFSEQHNLSLCILEYKVVRVIDLNNSTTLQ
jgi:hypothetical protein